MAGAPRSLELPGVDTCGADFDADLKLTCLESELENADEGRHPVDIKASSAFAGVQSCVDAEKDRELADVSRSGLCGRLSQNKYFENATLLVISVNAMWIGVDLEYNTASIWTEANLVFKIADNFFCTYFSLEVLVRFGAFQRKLYFWKDKSFTFDLLLVLLMVFETWVLVAISELGSSSGFSGDGLRQLSILRLLRLLRLTRMARLMRSMPELLALVKGLKRALRSVAVTFVLLILLMWIFAIIFTMQYRDATGELNTEYFSRIGISMVTLFVNGTLLDEFTSVAVLLKDDSLILMSAFFFFMLLSSLTSLNMLIGVLSDVVGKTTEEETANMAFNGAEEKLRKVFAITDTDGNMAIDCNEFRALLESKNPLFRQAFGELGLEEDKLEDLWKQLFDIQPSDPAALQYPKVNAWASSTQLSFKEFMDEIILICQRGNINIRELATLRRASSQLFQTARDGIENARTELHRVAEKCNSAKFVPPRNTEIKHQQLLDAQSRGKQTKLRNVPTEMLLNELSMRMARE